MNVEARARLHRALGDEIRLRIVDELALSDRTPAELGVGLDVPSNLLAHHLGVLEGAGLLVRRISEGDHRKRYLSLRSDLLPSLDLAGGIEARSVLLVCTNNSARSQFAEAVLRMRAELTVQSAGTHPAPVVHPKAVSAAVEMGFDIAGSHPKGYDDVKGKPDLVISVCDRAREAPLPFQARGLHWSIPDPVIGGGIGDFRAAFAMINDRVDLLVDAMSRGDIQ